MSDTVAVKTLKHLYRNLPDWVNQEKFYDAMIPQIERRIRESKDMNDFNGTFEVYENILIPFYCRDYAYTDYDSEFNVIELHMSVVKFSCETGDIVNDPDSDGESTDEEKINEE